MASVVPSCVQLQAQLSSLQQDDYSSEATLALAKPLQPPKHAATSQHLLLLTAAIGDCQAAGSPVQARSLLEDAAAITHMT